MTQNFVLFDDQSRNDLLPLTYMKPVSELRVGILTITEKWAYYLKSKPSWLTEPYLSKKFPLKKAESSILINGAVLPDEALVHNILKLKPGETLVRDEMVIAQHISTQELTDIQDTSLPAEGIINWEGSLGFIQYPWDIFQLNGEEIKRDFELITKGRKSAPLPSGVQVFGEYPVFLEEGADLRGTLINTTEGPAYFGKNAEVMEGAMIRGPFALCDHAQVKMGAKIYGNTSVGPYSRVGGELNNVVIQAYSNKAHDGFIGHSVIGEWCNIGADTNSSNLKNTYAQVKMWHYPSWKFINTGLQFAGLIMGDHSKCGINSMFNTGTVVGVCSNLYGSGFHRNFVPSFSWGGPQGFQLYDLEKAMHVAETVMARRGMVFDDTEREIFSHLHNHCRSFLRK